MSAGAKMRPVVGERSGSADMSGTRERRPPRTWPQRILITFCVGLIVLSLLGAGAAGYVYYQLGRVGRVNLAKGVLSETARPGEPQNILLVGSDSRAFVEPGSQDQKSFGSAGYTGGQRADTIILLRVDAGGHTAAMVSFPRDLLVRIAPDGHQQRINTAFEHGPEQLIQTIKSDFNIPIQHYAQVDFKGFRGFVDAVGGVKLFLASAVRDRVTGLNILDTGCVEVDGAQALAYVRSRHTQFLEKGGRWHTDPTGDLGRIGRQQDFIRRALRDALSKGLTNPVRLNRLANVGLKNVHVSRSLSLGQIVSLAKNFRAMSSQTLQQYALPVTATSWRGASVLKILSRDEPTAEAVLDVFRGIPTPPPPVLATSSVTVRVLNGSRTIGQAAEATSALQQSHFSVAAPGTAARTIHSVIRYRLGQEAMARLLARYLVSTADVVAGPDVAGADVVLTIGTDFAGIRQVPLPDPGKPAGPATPTNPAPTGPQC